MFDCLPDNTWGSLLFTSCHDGDDNHYFDSLVDLAGEAVNAIWGRCEGFPTSYGGNPDQFKSDFRAYMHAHSLPVTAFFSAYPDETVSRMHGYTQLRKYLETFLARPEVEKFTRLLPAIEIAPIVPRLSLLDRLGKLLSLPVTFLLGGIAPLALKVLTSGIEPIKPGTPSKLANIPTELTEREAIVQNELTVICDIKPGQLWRLRLTLRLIGTLLKYFGNGTLSNIATIHMARWVIFDDGKQLLFESNYDGTWESYIGDFVDKAADGMDAIWLNCKDYPPQGAHNIQDFKIAIRDHECRAQIFYSAYADVSVKNLRNDIAISHGVKNILGQPNTIDWLRKF
jgi:hypothetical protein